MDSGEFLVRGCPACGRENRGRRETCLYCGAVLPAAASEHFRDLPAGEAPARPEPPPGMEELGTLQCPRCESATLVEAEVLGLTMRRCPQCLGLFLDGNTFDFLLQRQAQLARQRGTEARTLAQVQRGRPEPFVEYIPCPVCRQQMTRANYHGASGVIFDHCGLHGVWLDDFELQQILTFIATGGDRLAAEIEREAKARIERHRHLMEDEQRRSWYRGTYLPPL